jgi:hypothetical protein
MTQTHAATMSTDEARATLKRLRETTSLADPDQGEPPRWLAEPHEVTGLTASRDDVQR